MTDFRSPDPHGRTAAFVSAVFDRQGPAFVKAWLSGRTCRFSDTSVLTTPTGVERLRLTCEREIAAHGVTVRADANVADGFHRDQDMRDATPKAHLPSRTRAREARP